MVFQPSLLLTQANTEIKGSLPTAAVNIFRGFFTTKYGPPTAPAPVPCSARYYAPPSSEFGSGGIVLQ